MSRPVVVRRSIGDYLFEAIGKLLFWLVSLLVRHLVKLLVFVLIQAAKHFRTTTALLVIGAAVYQFGWLPPALAAAAAFVAASTWKAAHRSSFDRYLGTWARTWWRRWWRYRRVWNDAFTRCGLAVEANGEQHPARLYKLTTTPYWDRLTVRLQIGQEPAQFRRAAEKLRTAFGAQRVTVREVAAGLVGVDLMRRDPLLDIVPATAMPYSTANINWSAIPVGITEYGDSYTLSVVGGHTSVAGASGAGKAGVQWNVLRGLAPAIADGTVRPVAIDPKVKEFRQAPPLFAPGDYASTPEEVVTLLDRLVDEMNAANEADGQAGERDFVPSIGRPLTLVMIDELAPLLKYWPRRLRDKIDEALGLLLTQGRAAGFIVFGSIQEPTKDVFKVRDLFSRRIALRLPTESHTDAALVEHAVDYGAQCHQISESAPGVFFSLEDGASSTMRARLGYVTNDDIAALVEYVLGLREVVSLDRRRLTDEPPTEPVELDAREAA
jgi:S-DNA-T family DNA segregation ATPase FtsK/SpoIIIE